MKMYGGLRYLNQYIPLRQKYLDSPKQEMKLSVALG